MRRTSNFVMGCCSTSMARFWSARPSQRDPFSFTVVPDFVQPAKADAIREDFPAIAYPGLLPVEATDSGPRFGATDRGTAKRGGGRARSRRNSTSTWLGVRR